MESPLHQGSAEQVIKSTKYSVLEICTMEGEFGMKSGDRLIPKWSKNIRGIHHTSLRDIGGNLLLVWHWHQLCLLANLQTVLCSSSRLRTVPIPQMPVMRNEKKYKNCKIIILYDMDYAYLAFILCQSLSFLDDLQALLQFQQGQWLPCLPWALPQSYDVSVKWMTFCN